MNKDHSKLESATKKPSEWCIINIVNNKKKYQIKTEVFQGLLMPRVYFEYCLDQKSFIKAPINPTLFQAKYSLTSEP